MSKKVAYINLNNLPKGIKLLNENTCLVFKNKFNSKAIINSIKTRGKEAFDRSNNDVINIHFEDAILHKDAIVDIKNLVYYLTLFNDAKTSVEYSNIRLLADNQLREGDKIRFWLDKSNRKRIGLISDINKNTYGLYYRVFKHNGELGEKEFILHKSKKYMKF
ncbi:hypothetical protein ACSW8S_18955 (plasmid) [Clostridium perfringens]